MQMDDIMFDPKISPLATSFDVTIPATGLPATPMPNVPFPSEVKISFSQSPASSPVSIDAMTLPDAIKKVDTLFFGTADDAKGSKAAIKLNFGSVLGAFTPGAQSGAKIEKLSFTIRFPDGFILAKDGEHPEGTITGSTYNIENQTVTSSKPEVVFSFYIAKLNGNIIGEQAYSDSVSYSLGGDLVIAQGSTYTGDELKVAGEFEANLSYRDAMISTNTIALKIDKEDFTVSSGATTVPQEVSKIGKVIFKKGKDAVQFRIIGPNISPLKFADNETLGIAFPEIFYFKAGSYSDPNAPTLFSIRTADWNKVEQYTTPPENFTIDSLVFNKTLTHQGEDTLVNANISIVERTLHIDSSTILVSELTGVFNGRKQGLEIRLIPGTLEIDKVTGKVKPEFPTQNRMLSMEGMPDFLRGGNVNLALKSPALSLVVLNPLGIGFSIQTRMTPYNSASTSKPIDLDMFVKQATGPDEPAWVWSKFWVAPANVPPPSADFTHDKKNITDLFKPIPDSLEIQVEAKTHDELNSEIYLGRQSELFLAYNMHLPLDFDSTFRVVYLDTISDLIGGLKPFVEYVSTVELKLVVTNSIPLNLMLDMTALDTDGAPIEGIVINSVEIKGASEEGVAEVSPIDITVKEKEEEGYTGSLAKMNSIKMEVKATASAAGKLSSGQYIYMTLGIGIPGGVTVGADALK
jgi:hypothetical protein